MYRERFEFAVKSGDATIGAAQLPAGKVHFDQTFNKDVETYRGELAHPHSGAQAKGPFELAVTSQGCADQGICYPPMEKTYRVQRRRAYSPRTPRQSTTAHQAANAGQLLVRARDQRRLRAVDARRRRILRRRRTVFSRWHGVEPAAVFVSDDPDLVRDHRRRRGARDAFARICAVGLVCDRHGARLYRARHRRRADRAKPRRMVAESVGARRVRRAARGVRRRADFGRRYHAARTLAKRRQRGFAGSAAAESSRRSRRWARCPRWSSVRA